MQTEHAQHNLNIASTEETFCVVCYETCNTKLSCCKQEICNGCSEEIVKLHENPTCPTCRAKFKSFTLSELSQMDTTVQLTYLKEKKYITNIYGKITLKPKTVKITKKNGITKYIKYRNIISYGLKENPKTIHSFKVNLDWQNWINKSLTFKRINKEPISYDKTIFNKIYDEGIMKYKIIFKNELIEILNSFQTARYNLNEISKEINILYDKYQKPNLNYVKNMAIKIEYSGLNRHSGLNKQYNIYQNNIKECKLNYRKWYNNACEKKLVIHTFNSLEYHYRYLIKEIELDKIYNRRINNN